MRLAITTILYFLCTSKAWSQTEPAVGSEPSAMEVFAAQQNVRASWVNEVARWENDGVQLIVTAVVLEEGVPSGRKLRGVKLQLADGTAKDEIYLDEEATNRTRSALMQIEDDTARERANGRPPQGNRCLGAKEFWPLYDWPWNRFHELNVDFCSYSGKPSLVLRGRGRKESFKFNYRTAADLAGTLSSAIEELKQH